jgi:type IV pilus assembly protein PilO
MAIKEAFEELKGFDINELDLESMGTWPVLVKIIVWLIAFAAVMIAGYQYVVADMQVQLASVQQKEQSLKSEFEKKSFKAKNLEAYRAQMAEMSESFEALVSQLPSETEVPGLLEDITNKGVENGLEISSIQLQSEQVKEFYIELPITIAVQGSYHDIGAFVSGIASLPRIVTLHDFSIKTNKEGLLAMTITAKTYRYKDVEGA